MPEILLDVRISDTITHYLTIKKGESLLPPKAFQVSELKSLRLFFLQKPF